MKKLYRLLSIFLALITMIASITVQSFANDPYESDAPVATAEFHFKHPLEYVPDEYAPGLFDPDHAIDSIVISYSGKIETYRYNDTLATWSLNGQDTTTKIYVSYDDHLIDGNYVNVEIDSFYDDFKTITMPIKVYIAKSIALEPANFRLLENDVKTDLSGGGTGYYLRAAWSPDKTAWSQFPIGSKLIVTYTDGTKRTFVNQFVRKNLQDFSTGTMILVPGYEAAFVDGDDENGIYCYDDDLKLGLNKLSASCYRYRLSLNFEVYVETYEEWSKRQPQANPVPESNPSVIRVVDTDKPQTSTQTQASSQTSTENKDKEDLAAWNGTPDKKIAKIPTVRVSVKKNTATVSWKPLTANQIKKGKVSQYEIQWSPKKSFVKSVTTSKQVKKSKKSITIKGLKSKKTYYVRVRAIRTSGKTKYVGKWNTKKIKTK